MEIDYPIGYLQNIYYEAIQEYIANDKFLNRLPEVLRQGLNVFLKFPNTQSAAIFLLRDGSFDFELQSCYPEKSEVEIKELFNYYVHLGTIGEALATGNIATGSFENNGISSISVPLVASWGVLGLVLLNTTDASLLNTELKVSTQLFARILSSNIENILLQQNLKATTSVLEQKVAAKTMDLAQSRRELKAIFDAVQTGIIIHDWDTFKITKINPVALDLIKIEENKIIGRHIFEFLEQIDYNSKKFSSETNYNFESYLINIEGEKIPIIRTTSFVNLGTLKQRIDCFIDITELKKYQDELKKMNETLELKVQERTLDLQILVKKLKDEIEQHNKVQQELKFMLDKEKELNQMKTRFVSMVSHEFRTPLTVIRSAAQMIRKYHDSLTKEEKIDYLNRILGTVDNLTDLIENVLFIGKEKENKTEIDAKEKIDLIRFTENLINEFESTLLYRREINFSTIGYRDKVETNERYLRLILMNLLSNAAKYSSRDTPIELKLYFNDDNYTYQVTDYGIGIPEDEQEKIFELFYRAENVGKISGSGIGLQVVLNSLQKLNGNLDLSSKLNKGTTFTVTIPYCAES
jgi:signal transduction histidine kinase